jgi:ribosome biogenesis GTPase
MTSLREARVLREDRGRYVLLGAIRAELTGRFRRRAKADDLPAVGDRVLYRPRPEPGRGDIHEVLPRRNALRRKVAGPRSRAQILAANVDVTFLVSGLDREFRLRRIERYLTLARECRTPPVVVLNKADLCDDVALRVRQVEGLVSDAPILTVSAVTGAGIPDLRAALGPGRTGVFLGSSGVGKSTLVNRLLGEATLPTRGVRADDDRGRHTTTRRELLALPDRRGFVIDTPGLREIQLWGDAESALHGFADVEEAAAHCRFRDCRHESEPGCAVHAALLDGRLDPDRYESFLQQRKELAYLERRRHRRR